MDERSIQQVAEKGDINGLYELIGLDRRVLERIHEIPFEDTPLHVAAAAGHTGFAIEIMRLKPSFSLKLNPQGFSPLHLALRNEHFDTVRQLVEIDSELLRVKGREGRTPLHCVVEAAGKAEDSTALIGLLAEFLLACPASIKDQTIEGETAVHIAVKDRNVRAFKVLFGWLERTGNEHVLSRKDNKGNTVLHVAASTNPPEIEVMQLLVEKVSKHHKNLAGKTAEEIVAELAVGGNREGEEALRSVPRRTDDLVMFLSSREGFIEKALGYISFLRLGLPSKTRNALLVVAVLIVAVTYQAVLNPPGGLSPGGDNLIQLNGTGTHINNATQLPLLINATGIINSTNTQAFPKAAMASRPFTLILIFNTIALMMSCALIILVLPVQLNRFIIFPILYFLVLTYMSSIVAISTRNYAISICVICGALLFVFAHYFESLCFAYFRFRKGTGPLGVLWYLLQRQVGFGKYKT